MISNDEVLPSVGSTDEVGASRVSTARDQQQHRQQPGRRSEGNHRVEEGVKAGLLSRTGEGEGILKSDEESLFPEQPSTALSSVQSVFTLCNSAIGAGVLSLPFAFTQAGLVGGIALCVIMAGAESFTMYVLSKFAHRHGAETYGSLVRCTLGRKLTALLAAIMTLHLFGSCVVYLIIIGDTLSALSSQVVGPAFWFSNRNIVITTMGGAILLPLCLFGKLGHLSFVSMFAVLGFMYTSGIVLYSGVTAALERDDIMADVDLVRWDIKALYAVPIVVFGFNCHANVVAVFTELNDAPDILFAGLPSSPRSYRKLPAYVPRPATTKVINMIGVILAAMMTILAGYVCVGSAGFIGYPTTMGSNVLNSLPQDKAYVQTAQLVVALVVLGHYPLNQHPARSCMHDVLNLLGYHHYPALLSHAFTLLFVGGSIGLALVITSLGAALHVLGGTAASFMIFCLPGLMLINAGIVKQSVGLLEQIDQDPSSAPDSVDEPLLRQAARKGIKKTGLVYSPGKSWWAGVVLLSVSVMMLGITVLTALVE